MQPNFSLILGPEEAVMLLPLPLATGGSEDQPQLWAVSALETLTPGKVREVRPSTHLDPQHQVSVGVLQLPLPALQLLGPLLLPLQPPDVVHRGLQNGSLIPAHVSGGDSGDKDLQSESADQLTGTVQESFFFFF